MIEISPMVLAAVVEVYDFTGIETLVDVGRGQGALVTGILKANPALRGILFDQPNAIGGAESKLQEEGVAGGCDVVGGDFSKVCCKMEMPIS